ncbi:MAG: hypothetical protein JNK04_05830, partial [Myxococcales bacterium]|nr:hypothetical protein [Myxococcales bacterium]
MNGTHRIVIAGALSALMGASACVEEEPEDEIVDVAADALAAPAVTFLAGAPASVDGMCVSVAAIDYFAPRCTLADVPEFVAYAADDVVLTSFLSTVLAGNATLQCRATGAPAPGYCVDVVDRAPGGAALGTDQLGNRKNYFVAYASNATGSVVKGHWNAQLDLDGGA